MSERNGRVLGLDYGRRRIGVALSDPSGLIAQGLPTIAYRTPPAAIKKIEAIARDHKVKEIVIGLPLTLSGERGSAANEAEKFARLLAEQLALPVHKWDERLTSVMAEKSLLALGKSPSRNKEKVDQIAAVLILQNFLDGRRSAKP